MVHGDVCPWLPGCAVSRAPILSATHLARPAPQRSHGAFTGPFMDTGTEVQKEQGRCWSRLGPGMPRPCLPLPLFSHLRQYLLSSHILQPPGLGFTCQCLWVPFKHPIHPFHPSLSTCYPQTAHQRFTVLVLECHVAKATKQCVTLRLQPGVCQSLHHACSVPTAPQRKEGRDIFVLQPALLQLGRETMARGLGWEQSGTAQALQGSVSSPSLWAAVPPWEM